ncbi:putative ABC transport system permease protein [Algoriphagus iocasae]|uniref:Putative ABC transport system permease protein n=1 Tax=Algoriphagus iocasae TaxID=1836499 RepID=A0A841MPT6_9BACT|nr:ABC transporter permease [Algoriphagus iocasae]MBB6327527.1 putative ABC transport system permease protein [Algoriphagus iocasae]
MLKNYLKIAFRNIRKNKLFSFLNIAGLSIGMAVCIMIMLFVNYERGFDSIHTKNIYRLDEVQNWEGMVAPQKVALSMYPMGPTLLEEFPEIMNFTRVRPGGELRFKDQEKEAMLTETMWADSSFFQIFDFKLVEGNRATALTEPYSIVLTEKSAEKIFGETSPMGKSLTLSEQDTISYTVTAVLEDIPENSHLRFEALTSFSSYVGPQAMDNWGGNWLTTYLELGDGADLDAMESKFPAFLVSHMGEEGAGGYELFLQPLSEVHAGSTDITHDYINYQKFDGAYTRIFFYIALIVLFIAGINFVNLSSAKSISRAMEIGVRKASGASKSQLYLQFIGESIVISLMAMVLATILVSIALPFLNEFSQRQLEFPLFRSPLFLVSMLLGAVLVGTLSGLYPALYLSNFNPVKVLKGSPVTGKRKADFRNILVVVQFSCAIFLIISTLFASRQVRFMQEKDLGFKHEQVITIPFGQRLTDRYETLKQALLASSQVEEVTASGQRLGNNLHQTGITFHGVGPAVNLATSQVVVDPDFLDVYKIELIAGRNFNDTEADNGNTYLINESLAKELIQKDGENRDIESLIGSQFGFSGMDSAGRLVGIVKDFNFNSLHHKIETLTIFNQRNWGFEELSVKISGENVPEALAQIESIWNTQVPEREFEYQFLDDHFKELYRADRTVNAIVGMLTGLSILISCLGLFGLVSFTLEQRVKEIGIRKVLGASVTTVVAILSKDFIKLVLVAIVIAVPVSWYVVDQWIQDFAYRINIEWWVFAVSGLVAILIALATVSLQAFKAALMNPVNSLKSE